MPQFKTIDTPSSVSAAIKAYRANCTEVRAEGERVARTRGKRWHFVGRGVEIIALDETGERNDDLGGPDYIGAKDLTVGYLREFVAHAEKCRGSRVNNPHELAAIHLAGGFDVYDDFATYMQDMRDGGCGDYEIWDDWAGQDIPLELLT